jgi:hypothetical protein
MLLALRIYFSIQEIVIELYPCQDPRFMEIQQDLAWTKVALPSEAIYMLQQRLLAKHFVSILSRINGEQ